GVSAQLLGRRPQGRAEPEQPVSGGLLHGRGERLAGRLRRGGHPAEQQLLDRGGGRGGGHRELRAGGGGGGEGRSWFSPSASPSSSESAADRDWAATSSVSIRSNSRAAVIARSRAGAAPRSSARMASTSVSSRPATCPAPAERNSSRRWASRARSWGPAALAP